MFAPAIVTLDRNRTQRDTARISEDPGRRPGRTAGGHIDDLAALGKAVMLCIGGCARKFNHKAYGYATRPNIPHAAGMCDGCKQFHPRNRLFLPKGRTFL